MALVLMSVGVCFPNDLDCNDEHLSQSEISKEVLTKDHVSQESPKSNEEHKEHHCICSLSCHNMFVQKRDIKTTPSAFGLKKTFIAYIPSYYPKITLALEKPPTV